ncbi:13119_t:CDS:2, partial [Gigaspora margarita]
LALEQQRRYDAEAEKNLMNIAYNNEAKEHYRWWFSYCNKNRRVSELIQEKFAIRLLLKQCHINAGTGINPVVNRDQAFGILRGCLYGRALEWFDRKILGKRWELHNIFANHGQTGIGALRGRTMAQMNTSNSLRNPLIAHDYANIAGNNTVTVGVLMIPAEAFTEDWRLAGGRPSDRPANAVNAGNANPIVFGDIRIGQALYWLKNKYPTVISEKCNLVYRSLAQGSEPIGEFYSKLLKYGKMLNLDEQQIKGQFLQGLSPDLEDDAERIGTEQLLADLFEILECIEMRRVEKKLGLVSKISKSSYKSAPKLITPAQES